MADYKEEDDILIETEPKDLTTSKNMEPVACVVQKVF